jgi:BASS family bile acid:Na+ symporter
MHKFQTLLLLLTAYAAATWFPAPGLWLRELNLFGTTLPLPQLLLAGLLFSAGLCAARGAVSAMFAARERFLLYLVAAWLVPIVSALFVVGGLWGIAGGPASVALGIVIVAAMPVANSSVGWATSMGGSVPLSIALLVVGTALSPLLSPLVIGAGAISLGTAEQALTETPWSEGMGMFFLQWVLMPVVSGVLIASRLSLSLNERIVPIARRLSFVILIVLNYLNGAPCLPALAQEPRILLWPVLGSASLLAVSSACVPWWLRKWARGIDSPTPAHSPAYQPATAASERTSLLLAVVMRNTGAALVFAGAALPNYVLVSLTIISYTMLQHCWVGFFLTPPAVTTTD